MDTCSQSVESASLWKEQKSRLSCVWSWKWPIMMLIFAHHQVENNLWFELNSIPLSDSIELVYPLQTANTRLISFVFSFRVLFNIPAQEQHYWYRRRTVYLWKNEVYMISYSTTKSEYPFLILEVSSWFFKVRITLHRTYKCIHRYFQLAGDTRSMPAIT